MPLVQELLLSQSYFHQKLSKKFDGSSIVGDKYPQLYKFWPSLFENFGKDGRFLFIMRDIEDVASSFNVRASNPKDKWPEENNYKKDKSSILKKTLINHYTLSYLINSVLTPPVFNALIASAFKMRIVCRNYFFLHMQIMHIAYLLFLTLFLP